MFHAKAMATAATAAKEDDTRNHKLNGALALNSTEIERTNAFPNNEMEIQTKRRKKRKKEIKKARGETN